MVEAESVVAETIFAFNVPLIVELLINSVVALKVVAEIAYDETVPEKVPFKNEGDETISIIGLAFVPPVNKLPVAATEITYVPADWNDPIC